MKGEDIYKKGLWTEEEDRILLDYVKVHGGGRWNRISKITGLKRCGKSCRLRWMNFLNPSVKRGQFTEQEEDLIIRLHNLLGNRWSLIAGRVPGRTDNQVKNHWNTHLCKKLGIKRENRKTALASLNPLSTISNNIMEVGTGVLTRMQTPLTQVSDDQPPPLASRCVHSFCPSNITDHSRERTLTSMEFLEGYSLGDEFWQDL